MPLRHGFEPAQVEAVIDPKLRVSRSMKASDMVKSWTARRVPGNSDFEAIEDVPLQGVRTFRVPGAVWPHQRRDVPAPKLLGLADESSLRLLVRA